MNATDERAGLMRSVLEQPACDAARLVLADWLTENGEEARAEFIRGHIDLHHRGFPGPLSVRTAALAATDLRVPRDAHTERAIRCAAILRQYVTEWLGDPFILVDPSNAGEWAFARGMLSRLQLSADEFAAHGPALLAAHPVERIDLPFVRVEIEPPDARGVWWVRYYDPDLPPPAHVPELSGWWWTRAEMIAGVVRDVRDLEAELA